MFKIARPLLIASFAASVLTGCVVESRTLREGPPTTIEDSADLSKSLKNQNMPGYSGEFAALGSAQTEAIVLSIKNGDSETINTVLQHPNDFTPPVLLALADEIMVMKQPFAAMFWHYTAQLRARSDANKSLDPTVKDALTRLNAHYGREVASYAKENLAELKMAMAKVFEYDEIAQRAYDPRWVAILGQDALTQTKIAFVQPSQYAEIDKKTREGFKLGFEEALKKTKAKIQAAE